MDFNRSEAFGQEEERASLMMNRYGGEIAMVKVVEYMLSSMSNELLCKLPDNSAFDFNYTQSSIWSPLVPHPSNPSSPAPDLQRKLSYDIDDMVWHNSGDTSTAEATKKLTASIKGKIVDSCVFNYFKFQTKIGKKKMVMKRRRSSFRGFDQLGSNSSGVVADSACSSQIESKGWKKVLKAASRRSIIHTAMFHLIPHLLGNLLMPRPTM